MAEDSHRVCPGCGDAADESRFCSTCGLELWSQAELPTREVWAQHAGGPAAGDGGAKSGSGQEPSTSRLSWAGSRMRKRAMVALVVGALLVGLAALTLSLRQTNLGDKATCADWNSASSAERDEYVKDFPQADNPNDVYASGAREIARTGLDRKCEQVREVGDAGRFPLQDALDEIPIFDSEALGDELGVP